MKTPGHFDFIKALEALREGKCVRRHAWTSPITYVYLQAPRVSYVYSGPLASVMSPGTMINHREHFVMRGADDKHGPWSGTAADIGSKDWHLYQPKT